MNWLRRVCLLVVLVFIAISPLFAATQENQAPRDIRGKTQRPGGALREAQGKQAPPLQSETELQGSAGDCHGALAGEIAGASIVAIDFAEDFAQALAGFVYLGF